MTAYLLIFLLLLVGGALSLVVDGRTRQMAYAVYLSFAFPILLAFACLRAPYVDADYGLYSDWYGALIAGTLSGSPFLKDPFFAMIGLTLHQLGLGLATLLSIYSIACLGGQMLFAKQALTNRWFALGVFLILCRFFIPHEMTQIRVSVAMPLMSLAVLQFFSRKVWQGCALLLLALCFHFSALLAVPLCAAAAMGWTFQSRKWLVGIAVAAVLGYFAFARIALLLTLFSRTSDYVTGVYDAHSNSLLSFYLLCRLTMVAFAGIFLWKRLDERERPFVIASAFGSMLEIALVSNDTLSLRSGELFGLFDMTTALILIPYLRPRTAILYVILLLSLGANFFRATTNIIRPYASLLNKIATQ